MYEVKLAAMGLLPYCALRQNEGLIAVLKDEVRSDEIRIGLFHLECKADLNV